MVLKSEGINLSVHKFDRLNSFLATALNHFMKHSVKHMDTILLSYRFFLPLLPPQSPNRGLRMSLAYGLYPASRFLLISLPLPAYHRTYLL